MTDWKRNTSSKPVHDIARAEDTWQAQLRNAVRDLDELAALLELPVSSLPTAATAFPLLVPRGFVARMRKRDPDDPLLRQVLPAIAELDEQPGFGDDPINEQSLARNGSIRKYPGRVLLITTGACPVHCRYCFRRVFPYGEQLAARDDWRPAIDEIRATPGISEVILSGGDPLTLGNARLERLVAELEGLPEVRTLRIHTRFPIVLPERVDDGLVALLRRTRLATVIVVHANHAAEIDGSVVEACEKLKACAHYLLNQSVLLKGVNDSADALIALSEALLEAGIVPYYLHLLDRVTGAAHFEVGARTAASLIDSMRKQVPGYFVPTLVVDRPGELSKTPI